MQMKKKREMKNKDGNPNEEVKENQEEFSDEGSDSDYVEPPTKRRKGGCPFMQDGFQILINVYNFQAKRKIRRQNIINQAMNIRLFRQWDS